MKERENRGSKIKGLVRREEEEEKDCHAHSQNKKVAGLRKSVHVPDVVERNGETETETKAEAEAERERQRDTDKRQRQRQRQRLTTKQKDRGKGGGRIMVDDD
jgi:hypothetical protein